MNILEKLLQELDLKLDEEFEIVNHVPKYKFTEQGLYKRWIGDDKWTLENNLISSLVLGHSKVFKRYKPLRGGYYYIPNLAEYDDNNIIKLKSEELVWLDSKLDFHLHKNGLVCEDEYEADELTNKILEFTRNLKPKEE